MAQIVIFGAGHTAKMAHYYFSRDSEHEVVAFTADREHIQQDEFQGLPVVAVEDAFKRYPASAFGMFVALSYSNMNKDRERVAHEMKEGGYELVSYVSSHCTYLTDNPVGENCMIMEDNTVQPFTTIGNNVILWSGNHIGHESIIDDNVFVTSHVVIAGNVHVKRNCFLGINATVRDGIVLAEETCVGAGAIIMKDTEPKGVYIPERSKKFKKTSDQITI